MRRRELRRVRTNNKEWESALTVRRTWLREILLARRTAPTDAPRYLATVLARPGDGSHAGRPARGGGDRAGP